VRLIFPGPVTAIIDYGALFTVPLAAGTYVLPLISTPDPAWGNVPLSVNVVLTVDCGSDPGEVLETEGGEWLLAETGMPLSEG
jgi:hypothetical protein